VLNNFVALASFHPGNVMFNVSNNILIYLCKRGLNPLLILVCIIVAFVILSTPSTRKVFAAEDIKVAAIFSVTGIAAEHNAPMIKMAELAVSSINQNGGILGRSVDLIIIDNKSTPIGSAQAAQKAVDLDVTAVIGAHWSSHSLAMAPIFQKAGIPMIAPASTNPEITQDRSYIFRACFVDSFQGKAMAQFARKTLKAARAVVLSNVDEKYSTTLAHYFSESFVEHAGEVAANIHYRGDAMDFSGIISEIKQLSPEVIYIPGYSRDSGLFIKQARKLDVEAVFLGGDGWGEIAAFSGDAINGSYQTAAWHPKVPYTSSLKLQDIYQQKYNSPIRNFNSPLAYDAVMLLKKAIEVCRCIDKQKIRDSLIAMEPFPGATGVISFDEQGDPEQKKVIIVQFQENSPVYIEALRP
jgi:branched-chain amino acid transport system substrate-binding protein